MRYCFAPAALLVFVASVCHAEEKTKLEEKEKIAREFLKAFFTEDRDSVEKLATGECLEDLRAYFWIKDAMQGKQKEQPRREWKAKVEVSGNRREMVAGPLMHSQEEADIFVIKVDDREFDVGVNDNKKVVLMTDASKQDQKAKLKKKGKDE